MTDRLLAAITELVDALRAEVRTDRAADSPDRLLSVLEAASRLGIGRSALYGEIAAGRIRTVHVGRRRLVPTSAITAYLDQLSQTGGDQ